MTTPSSVQRPFLVSFSGLDGSGKTTQIENLRAHLQAAGLKSVLITFWDDVVVATRYREGFVHAVYGSEKGIGAPGKPVERRDKNVRRWYLTIARHALYFLDAVHLCEVVARARRGSPDVIIMDRYIYDELANLPIANGVSRSFIRAVGALVPKPDVAYLLDADVEAARARKPEYPVEFMYKCRAAYMKLNETLRHMTVIPPLPLEKAKQAVVAAFEAAFHGKHQTTVSSEPQPSAA
jgi:thymidylate kinase